ncbi:hypothetical protein VW29_04835 [Devosia limi DSM 17137]|uniref:Calcineurin-like phosphoesterase n=1 Tax=Devosia limi DSM 17137 TaxID=1121477 RepID=A0A0F5LUC0_9HYPH|nr:metallophosphoesterase [Devosia limi]KKB85938.1 hypothetical protein VW29_04835 [Devosia limi DSM 17137]SHF01327.1 Calcineurin-like phosphoesterase [Devosia limi DSM 17137]
MVRIAILADPHFHDVDFDPAGEGGGPNGLRTLVDTTESTRIFNESGPAFRAALDDVVARGISLVVIAGDLTDDGQVFNWRTVNALLDEYRARGLRFYATPGNHDLFAMAGRNHDKRFLLPDGSNRLVSSNASSGAEVIAAEMYCPGYPDVMPMMADLGYVPGPGDLHWESPFGTKSDWDARSYQVRSPDGGTIETMLDASYLVEPIEGLWLLSLDANVYRPNDRSAVEAGAPAFRDCTDVGWNAVLTDKPHLLTWAADVAQRARQQGKRLVAFSHYPVVDPLNGSAEDERSLLGDTGFVRRMPEPAVAAALAAAGIGVHFSGHWHINNTASYRGATGSIVNVAVPSLVAYPPGYKLVDIDPNGLQIETVSVREAPGYDVAFDGYAAEAQRDGLAAEALFQAASHGAFIDAHLHALVQHRYLPKEWPADLARLVPLLSLDAVAQLADAEPISSTALNPLPLAGAPSLFDLVVDWYALRKGADIAKSAIPAERMAHYRSLIGSYGRRQWPEGSLQRQLGLLLSIMERYLQREPSLAFHIAQPGGAVSLSAAVPISARRELAEM